VDRILPMSDGALRLASVDLTLDISTLYAEAGL